MTPTAPLARRLSMLGCVAIGAVALTLSACGDGGPAPESATATVDLAVSLAQLARVEADPLPRRREAKAILQKLEGQERLTDLGATVLAKLR